MNIENKNRTPYNPATPMPGALYPVGGFPLVKDTDVAVGESTGRLVDYIPIILTPQEYNALCEAEEGEAVKVMQDGVEVEMVYDPNKIYFIKLIYEEIVE